MPVPSVACLGFYCADRAVGMFIYDREHIVDKGGSKDKEANVQANAQRNIIGNIVLALRPWNTQLGNRKDSVREKSLVYGRGLQMAARFWIGYVVKDEVLQNEKHETKGATYDMSPKWSGVAEPVPLAPPRSWRQWFDELSTCCRTCVCTRSRSGEGDEG
jgi:hypothetical protein